MTEQSEKIDELKAELEAAREVAKAAHEEPWEACASRWEADEAAEAEREADEAVEAAREAYEAAIQGDSQ